MKIALQNLRIIVVVCFLTAALTSCGQRNTDSTLNSSSVLPSSSITSTSSKPIAMSKELTNTIIELMAKCPQVFDLYKDLYTGDSAKEYTINGGHYGKLCEYRNAAFPNPLDLSRVNTIEELKALTETVFTKEFAEETFYYDFKNKDSKFIESNGEAYVNLEIGGYGGIGTWSTDTMQITLQTKDMLIVEMVTYMEEDNKEIGKLHLKKVNGEWRIDDLE